MIQFRVISISQLYNLYLPFASVQEFPHVVSFVVEGALLTPKHGQPVNKQHMFD